MTNTQPLPWFALEVKSRSENSVALHLRARGYECFLPKYKSRRKWSDRIKHVELPLFPGYLFSRVNVEDRLPVLTTPGVIQIVGSGRTPIPIRENEIHTVQTVVDSGVASQPWPFVQIGDRVRMEQGPLLGLEGILLQHKGSHRIVVSVSLLQRSIALEVDASWVSRTSGAHPVGLRAPRPVLREVVG